MAYVLYRKRVDRAPRFVFCEPYDEAHSINRALFTSWPMHEEGDARHSHERAILYTNTSRAAAGNDAELRHQLQTTNLNVTRVSDSETDTERRRATQTVLHHTV